MKENEGGAVASWLVRLRSERSGFEPWPGTLRCVLGQDILLSQCLSPPRCINGYQRTNAGGNPVMDWHPIQGGVEILSVASCYGNRDKLRTDEPLSSYADFPLPYLSKMTKMYKKLPYICEATLQLKNPLCVKFTS